MRGSECHGKEFGFYFKCGGKWPNLIYVFQESVWLGYETLTTGVQGDQFGSYRNSRGDAYRH